TGMTGHTEIVRVVYDPATIPVERLLKVFFEAHDPTQGMRQGNDVGTQYRSAIYWTTEAQRAAAETARDGYAQALAAVGIDARLVNNDSAAHLKAVYTDHAFDLAVGPPVYRGDPAISTTILFQGGLPDGVPFSNQGGYANPKVDAL
ncbi:peptide-methionine (S)-S-oxide reductase, partial [Mycobacterium tuberculosis]|nr:peptide-methionine (S)-S-oxide reductase [Mycobacterium tuberculosis]